MKLAHFPSLACSLNSWKSALSALVMLVYPHCDSHGLLSKSLRPPLESHLGRMPVPMGQNLILPGDSPTSQCTCLLPASMSVNPTGKKAPLPWRKSPLRSKVFQNPAYIGSTFVKTVFTGQNFTIISVFGEVTAISVSGLFRLAGSRVVFSTGTSQLLKNRTFFYPDRGVLQGR